MVRRITSLILPLFLAQCAWKKAPTPPPKPAYYIDATRYESLKTKDTHLRIDLVSQKAHVLDADDRVVIETDISTGKPGHETPTGSFRISERLEDKRSNRYGRYKDPASGTDLGASADFPAPPKGALYEGYSMPYWMRLTWDGVGIHVGQVVPRSAVSYGCIRVPKGVQPLIFEKCRTGTPVKIIGAVDAPAHPPR